MALSAVQGQYQPWWELDLCPSRCLCHSPTRPKIAKLVKETRDDPIRSHGVYVLDCKTAPLDLAKRRAFEHLDITQVPWWLNAACKRDRLVYVGVSKRMVDRLHAHANFRGDGGSFMKVFPPKRLIDINWFNTLAESYRAEVETADYLDNELEDAYVYQR